MFVKKHSTVRLARISTTICPYRTTYPTVTHSAFTDDSTSNRNARML